LNSQQKNLFEREPPPWEMDDAAECRAATVVFSEGARGEYDYLIPDARVEQLQVGCRVRVPLGASNRLLTGYCVRIHTKQTGRRLKPIRDVIDDRSIVSAQILALTKWMAEYYLCSWGQVLDGVIPASVRGRAGTREVQLLSVSTEVAARLASLKLPPKQLLALKTLAACRRPMTVAGLAKAAACTQAPISGLRKKGLIQSETQRVAHYHEQPPAAEREQGHVLNHDQQQALDAITAVIDARRYQPILLHGVTGSGKTEVYIRAIEQVVQSGRQAIVLVPEISLTPQVKQRFLARFDHVAVLHSHMKGPERHWHWKQIAQGITQVVVGARSAVFAPTAHLGLIVIDEEHDWSFKQDTTPRYHARDVALRRALAEKIPVVLGSATPALESWHAAQSGEYQLVPLPKRVSSLPLPHVSALDLRIERLDRSNRGAITRQLHRLVVEAVKAGGQVILLLNRRGFSTHIQCPACGEVAGCPHCEIALTYHRDGEKAICHYCDYEIAAPACCPSCQFEGIRYGGLGTQKLEAEVKARFPGMTCLRMDSDTMRKPGSHDEALSQFRSGKAQILVGTQMIAKGHDFPNVTLVGVINADTALHLPDFRAAERTFQLVTQVAGRTGRGEKGGQVIVQTFSPEHPSIEAAIGHDYLRFTADELPIRKEYGYPPYGSMVRLVVRGPSQSITQQFAMHIGEQIQQQADAHRLDARLLGPTEAPVAKLRGLYRFHMLFIGTPGQGLRDAVKAATAKLKPPEDVQWIADVDPLDML